MVKLIPTNKRLSKGDHIIKVTDEEKNDAVKEIWINSGGSFDSNPFLNNVGKTSFRLQRTDRQSLLDESYRLWKFDALGGTIVRTTTYFTLSRGVNFEFDDEKAQFYAQKFYKKNKLEIKMRSASDEGTAFGEVFIWLRPKFDEVRLGSKVLWRQGDTQVTFIPPDNISNIETSDEDIGDVFNYIYEYIDGDQSQHSITIPDISKYDIHGSNKEIGCLLHVKFNAGNMDPFGHSDLIPIQEWLDNYQEYLRDGVIINKLYRSPCYDVSIEDGSQEEVSEAIARYRGWRIGSNPVHNSREQWKILEFSGPSSNNQEARRALLLIIAAGVGFAEYMLADAGNSNLASAKSQQLPVMKKFEDRQDVWAWNIMQIFQFCLFIKSQIGNDSSFELQIDDEGDVIPFAGTVEFPSISRADDLEIAQTNTMALEKGYMSPRTAARRLNLDFGRELDIVRSDLDEIKKLREEADKAGVSITIGGPINDNPNMSTKMPGQGSGGPSDGNPPNNNGSRSGEVDLRSRNRDRQSGGSNSNGAIKT